jgi:hypothetical protein
VPCARRGGLNAGRSSRAKSAAGARVGNPPSFDDTPMHGDFQLKSSDIGISFALASCLI